MHMSFVGETSNADEQVDYAESNCCLIVLKNYLAEGSVHVQFRSSIRLSLEIFARLGIGLL